MRPLACLGAIRETAATVRKSWKKLLPLALLDLTFFVVFALLHTFIVLQALPDLSSINRLVAEESQNLPQGLDAEQVDPSKLEFSFPLERFETDYGRVLGYAALYLALMFIVYSLIFAYTWLRTSAIAGKKTMPYVAYLKRFAAINAIWLLIYVVGFYLVILATATAMFSQVTLVSPGAIDAVALALADILLYLGMVSHALAIDHEVFPLLRKTFVVGARRILPLGCTFLLIAGVYVLLSMLLSRASVVSAGLAFALFVLLLVPWTTVSRLLFAVAARDAAKN